MSQTTINIESYLETYEQLKQAVAGLTEEQLTEKEAPGKWSITEVLAHLADHNIVVSFRLREILAGSEARLPAFNQDNWVAGQTPNAGHASDILDVFHALLVYNSLLFRRLTAEDWEKTALNFKGDPVALSTIIQSFINHAGNHIAQIERIKSKVLLPQA
ncbi:DinB family protein [Paenibacillus sepulcri]|uniref:DinB family protein n=1 Tax=Paenibacillus sepulcri TaxID=359917 RepID=A0ABS7CDE5_9BACL|nr:DinB family protein [Paenibacillus sepulcri]